MAKLTQPTKTGLKTNAEEMKTGVVSVFPKKEKKNQTELDFESLAAPHLF